MSENTVPCEICGKEKKLEKMIEYYLHKRTDSHKIMYKCKNHDE